MCRIAKILTLLHLSSFFKSILVSKCIFIDTSILFYVFGNKTRRGNGNHWSQLNERKNNCESVNELVVEAFSWYKLTILVMVNEVMLSIGAIALSRVNQKAMSIAYNDRGC